MIGTSLIEIMISLLLLSILLLGLDAMQITALNQAKNAYFFSVASQQLNQMTERAFACKENCNEQVIIWNRQNAEVLPQGKGKMSGHYPNDVITLIWGNKQAQSCQQNKLGREGCLQIGVPHA